MPESVLSALHLSDRHFKTISRLIEGQVGIKLPAGKRLMLEGRLYDRFGAHGPAIMALLVTIPLTLGALLFLPEPAGKRLEELTS